MQERDVPVQAVIKVTDSYAVVSQHLTRTHGQGKINLELLLGLARRGFEIDAVSSWIDGAAPEAAGINWREVKVSPRVPTNWLREQWFAHRVKRLLGKGGTVAVTNGAAVLLPSRVNIAMFVHGAWLDSPWHPGRSGGAYGRYFAAYTAHAARQERAAFGMAQHVVALSAVVADELVRYCDVDREKVSVIPPGVDSADFRPRRTSEASLLRALCGITEDDSKMLAVFVGEIRTNRKNLDLVFEAMMECGNFRLAVVGADDGSPYPLKAASLGIADQVTFLGQRSDVADLMRGADVFVFPTHYEPFGIVVTEAMASGLPVVVTRNAGGACVVTHSRDGFLLENGADLAGLLDAIGQLADPSIRRTMGQAARLTAKSLTWDRMVDAYVPLLMDG